MAAPRKRQKFLSAFFRPLGNVEENVVDAEPASTSVTESESEKNENVVDAEPASTSVTESESEKNETVQGSGLKEDAASSKKDKSELTSDKTNVIWSSEEVLSQLQEMWPMSKVHNYFNCRRSSCFNISTEERSVLKEKQELKRKDNKKPDMMRHDWFSTTKYWPICYVEREGFFCLLCNMKNVQNQSRVFVEKPSIRLKEDTLKTHMSSSVHASAIEADLLHKVSVEKKEVETSVLKEVFSVCYWLMKEFVANRKLISLLELLEKVMGITQLQYFNHRSSGSQREIFLTLGNTVKQDLLEKVKNAKAYGIMIDEVTDVSVCSQLVTFIQFWDSDSQKTEVSFLSAQNVLEDFNSCNAEAITTLVLRNLEECGLDIENLMGLSTDGASVMIGKANGVAAKLRVKNEKLLNIHCVCHRLALACTDSCSELKYIQSVEDTLRNLWYYFKNSPKKMSAFLKIQLQLHNMDISNSKSAKLSRRLKKACQTRWLSFGASVSAAVRDFEAVLLTLQQIDDATGVGLLKKMKQVKFLGALYILNAVLPILSRLSQQFQAGRFHFSMVKPAMKRVQSELMELKNGMEPVEKLKSDIDSTYVNISDTLKLTKNTEKELTSMLSKYTEALSVNMEQRLGAFPDVIGAYSIFDPISLRSHKDIDMYQYGTEEISILGNHFYPGSAETIAKLKTQWHQLKYFLSENPICVPDGSQSSTYLMTFMLQNKGIFHPVLFAEILYVVEVGLSLPCSNAWPERGASILKLAKSKTRNRLENDMLNSIMHVTINGPTATSNLCSDIVSTAVSTWCQAKKRKKLKTKRIETVLTPVTEDMNMVEEEFGQEASCLATSNEPYIGVESDRVPVGVESDSVAVDCDSVGAEVVADKLGLPPIDTDEDSAFESDYDSN